MKKKYLAILLSAALLIAAAAILIWAAQDKEPERESVVIAMPRSSLIRNMDTNFYKLWLEEQTGLSLSFVYLEEGYSAAYLDSAFANGDVTVDALFSLELGDDYLTALSVLQDFGEKGYILPLNSYLNDATNLERVFSEFGGYDLRKVMSSSDGNIYFMPGLDASRGQSAQSMLWLNKSWLSELRLPVPQTTQQLREVLEAFLALDPNGNGLSDEIALCGTLSVEGQKLYNSIINSFIYCDPDNSYLLVRDGEVMFAPTSGEWRQAMQYLSELYAQALISPLLLELSGRSFSELANNPANLLGGFTANHITDVLMQNSPEIISNYIHVAPISGPDGGRNATQNLSLPKVAGVITASCKNPQAVFELLDLMLSEEAFLIGRYGEEGADWERAKITDMDFYGRKASVRIINHLSGKVQNKHFGELGPFFAYPEYADGVSFAGLESDQEYINARAVQAYEAYMPHESLGAALYTAEGAGSLQDLRSPIDAYTLECIERFITGELDPFDDSVWQSLERKYDALGLPRLIDASQAAYDTMMGEKE